MRLVASRPVSYWLAWRNMTAPRANAVVGDTSCTRPPDCHPTTATRWEGAATRLTTPKPAPIAGAFEVTPRHETTIIAAASGPLGTNREYLEQVAAQLQVLQIEDDYIADLLRHVQRSDADRGGARSAADPPSRAVAHAVRPAGAGGCPPCRGTGFGSASAAEGDEGFIAESSAAPRGEPGRPASRTFSGGRFDYAARCRPGFAARPRG